MDREHWDLAPDSVQRALDQLLPPSAGKVVREAFYGTRRFEDLLRHTGLTAPVLSARLKDLQARELLERTPYKQEGARTRFEYRLTERGRDLATAIIALLGWADRWLPHERGPTVALEHVGCGRAVHAALSCEAGHHDLAVAAVAAVPGPGARAHEGRRPRPACP